MPQDWSMEGNANFLASLLLTLMSSSESKSAPGVALNSDLFNCYTLLLCLLVDGQSCKVDQLGDTYSDECQPIAGNMPS